MRVVAPRAVPLVALVGVVAALVATRACRRMTAPSASRGGDAPSRAGSLDAPDGGAGGRGELARAVPVARDGDAGAEVASPTRMLHEDARRTHRARGVKGPVRASVTWTAHLAGAIEAQVVTSPDESALYVASLDGKLTALDSRTGDPKWSVSLGDRAYATPCVAKDGVIYAGSDAKRFFAITPAGAVAWKLEVDGEADTGCAFTSDDQIVFAAGSHVYAVRRGGDVAWRFDARKKVFTAPAIADDGTIAFGSQDHRAYALTPAGALAWSADLGADVDGGPAIGDDGDVFVGTDAGDVVRLRGKTGEVAWRTPLGGFVRGALAVARDGAVLAGVYGPTPRVARVAPDGLLVAWLAVPGTGAREFGVHGGPIEDATGALYFGAQDDVIRGLGPAGGASGWEWRYEASGDCDAPLTLLRSGALVAACDGAARANGTGGNVILFAP